MTDLDHMREFISREPVHDRSGEIAALQSEIDMLRHELMKVRFENTALIAANTQLSRHLDERTW